MIGMFNADSSYFYVSSPDIPIGKNLAQDLSEKVVSFTIEEEIGRIISGSIQINDPTFVYAGLLRQGKRLDISWGYKKMDEQSALIFQQLAMTKLSEMKGTIERRGFKAFIQNVSGSASEGGSITYNCNFMGLEYLQLGKNRYFSSGTKRDVIQTILQDLGITVNNQYINFARMGESVNKNTAVNQWKPPFLFLSELSFEWRAVFKIGYDKSGNRIGCFADYGTKDLNDFVRNQAQALTGSTVTVNYQGDSSRTIRAVKSYTWQSSIAGSGSGDNAQMIMIDGKVSFLRYKAEDQTAEVWQLNEDGVKKFVKNSMDNGKLVDAMKWVASKDTFDDDVKKFFTRKTVRTAPQGMGYSFVLQMIGDPLFTAPCKVEFNQGFPDFCNMKNNKFTSYWTKKVSHVITRAGYQMTADVADAFTISGGSLL